MHYRKDIDGLRALAVLPVIFFHAGFSLFSGGYVGVDVFFVISGYLITHIIMEEQAQGRFSLRQFYERRARRILPALVVVILVTIPFAAYFMIPDQIKDFSQSLIATALFVSNFYFQMDSGYFGADEMAKPLLHTWSLSIEEQYYLFFPLLLMFLWRRPNWSLRSVVIGIGLASLATAEIGRLLLGPEANFFFTPSRIWELMIGSGLAIYTRDRPPSQSLLHKNLGSLLGLGLIAFAVFYFDHDTPSPGRYMLVPTVGAALILLYADGPTLVGRLLRFPLLVGVGLVSYSAYLWHQPIFAIARVIHVEEIAAEVYGGLILLAFTLAVLSWKFVEQPFRKKTRFQTKTIFRAAGAGLGLVLLLGLLGARYNPVSHVSLVRNYKVKQLETYESFIENPALQESFQRFEQDDSMKLLIYGDSHAKDTFNALYLHQDAHAPHFSFRPWVKGKSCMETYTSPQGVADRCNLEKIAPDLLRDMDWLLLSGRWSEKHIEPMVQMIGHMQRLGKRVAVSGRTTEFGSAPILMHKIFWENNLSMPSNDLVHRRFWQQRNTEFDALNEQIRRAVEAAGGVYLDKLAYSCNEEKRGCYALNEAGYPLHYDYGHYTLDGAEFFGRRMLALDWLAPLRAQATRQTKN